MTEIVHGKIKDLEVLLSAINLFLDATEVDIYFLEVVLEVNEFLFVLGLE
jgi:hypothetical protein